jgi:hypothetical protein
MKGLNPAIRCKVHGGSSKLRLPVEFPSVRWIVIGSHELSITAAILSHLYTHLILQVKFEQLKLSKTDLSMW